MSKNQCEAVLDADFRDRLWESKIDMPYLSAHVSWKTSRIIADFFCPPKNS